MCTTCGCGTGEVRIDGRDAHEHEHIGPDGKKYRHVYAHDGHSHAPVHDHEHTHGHGLLHSGLGAAHSHAPGLTRTRMAQVERDILSKNNEYAGQNRALFRERGILALNLVSSPGSGKTTLLVKTIDAMQGMPLAVIEGDQQTANDAERIRATRTPAIQINTGKGCHLDAHMVGRALKELDPPRQSVLFIENVGNLVCPAAFDLGEAAKVVILSVTEGEDKPLKYPDMFQAARLMLLNKCDLLPHLTFQVEQVIENARRVNPAIEVIHLSATSGEGMDEWLAWIARERGEALASQFETADTLKRRTVELEAKLAAAQG